MTTYINIKNYGETETIDEFETRKEALKMAIEYNYGDSSNHYYLSQKCTKTWGEKR